MLTKERYLSCLCIVVLLASGVQSASKNATTTTTVKDSSKTVKDLSKLLSSGGSQGPWLPIFPSSSTLSRRISGVTTTDKKIESKETFMVSSSVPAPSIYNNFRSDVTPRILHYTTFQQESNHNARTHQNPNNQFKSQIVRGSYSLGRPSSRGVVTNVQIITPGPQSQPTSTKSAYDTSSTAFFTQNPPIPTQKPQFREESRAFSNEERMFHKSAGANYAQPQANIQSFSGRQLQSMIYANQKNIPPQQSTEKFPSSEKFNHPPSINNNNNNNGHTEKNVGYGEQLSRHNNFPQQLSISSFVESIQMPKSFNNIENFEKLSLENQNKQQIRVNNYFPEQKSINFDDESAGKNFDNFPQQQQQFINENNANNQMLNFNSRSFLEPRTAGKDFSVQIQQSREFHGPELNHNLERVPMNPPFEEKFIMPPMQEQKMIIREFSKSSNFEQPQQNVRFPGQQQNIQPKFNENRQLHEFRTSGIQAEESNKQQFHDVKHQEQFPNFERPQNAFIEQQQQQPVQHNSNFVEVFNKIEPNGDLTKSSGLGEHSIIGGGFTNKAVAVINQGNNFNNNNNFKNGNSNQESFFKPETHFYIMPSNNNEFQDDFIKFDNNNVNFENQQNSFQNNNINNNNNNNFNAGFDNSQRISINSLNQQRDDRSSMQGGHTNNLNHFVLNGESLYRGNLADNNFDEFGRSISPRISFAATKPFQHINIHSGYLGFRPGTIYSRVYPKQVHKKAT